MLARGQRMVRSDEFRITVRSGLRARQRTLVAHLLAPTSASEVASTCRSATRVGFVVGKSVGNAVERNAVKRRLRHLIRPRLDGLPVGARVVIRALPGAASLSSVELAGQLDGALMRIGDLQAAGTGGLDTVLG